MSFQLADKLVINVPPEYVDLVEDSIKSVVVLAGVWLYAMLQAKFPSVPGVPMIPGYGGFSSWSLPLMFALPFVAGLAFHHLVVRRFVAVMPTAGAALYYMAKT